jgi:hypothetical protein
VGNSNEVHLLVVFNFCRKYLDLKMCMTIMVNPTWRIIFMTSQ